MFLRVDLTRLEVDFDRELLDLELDLELDFLASTMDSKARFRIRKRKMKIPFLNLIFNFLFLCVYSNKSVLKIFFCTVHYFSTECWISLSII